MEPEMTWDSNPPYESDWVRNTFVNALRCGKTANIARNPFNPGEIVRLKNETEVHGHWVGSFSEASSQKTRVLPW